MSRRAWVAIALSLAIPGLGHVHAGAFALGFAFAAADRLLPPALDLLTGAGVLSVKALALCRLALPV